MTMFAKMVRTASTVVEAKILPTFRPRRFCFSLVFVNFTFDRVLFVPLGFLLLAR